MLLLQCGNIAAQGTLADYRRAYSLYDKFKSANVYDSPYDISYNDSLALFSYAKHTAQGDRFITLDAAGMKRNEYDTKEKMNASLGIKTVKEDKQPFGRKEEPNWMEVDEERDSQPVVSPDGKLEAYIEGDNVVLHTVGRPYTEKRILSTDGTLSDYCSAWIQW